MFGDVALYSLALRWSGNSRIAGWVLVAWLSSWFGLYTAVRTLSNTMETTVTLCGLALLPPPTTRTFGLSQIALPLALAGLSCLIRPTAGDVPSMLQTSYYHSYTLGSSFWIASKAAICSSHTRGAVDCNGASSFVDGTRWRNDQLASPRQVGPRAVELSTIQLLECTVPGSTLQRLTVTQGSSAFYGQNPLLWYFYNVSQTADLKIPKC